MKLVLSIAVLLFSILGYAIEKNSEFLLDYPVQKAYSNRMCFNFDDVPSTIDFHYPGLLYPVVLSLPSPFIKGWCIDMNGYARISGRWKGKCHKVNKGRKTEEFESTFEVRTPYWDQFELYREGKLWYRGPQIAVLGNATYRVESRWRGFDKRLSERIFISHKIDVVKRRGHDFDYHGSFMIYGPHVDGDMLCTKTTQGRLTDRYVNELELSKKMTGIQIPWLWYPKLSEQGYSETVCTYKRH